MTEEVYDDIVKHIGSMRRASLLLYSNGMQSRGDHARVMNRITKRENALVLQAEKESQS